MPKEPPEAKPAPFNLILRKAEKSYGRLKDSKGNSFQDDALIAMVRLLADIADSLQTITKQQKS